MGGFGSPLRKKKGCVTLKYMYVVSFEMTSYIILQQQLIDNVSKKDKSDTEIKCDLFLKGYARG